MNQHIRPRQQRGASLVEALLAFLVLSLGMVGMVKLQSHLRSAADLARQHSEALRLAQEEIESLRGFVTLATTPGLPAYADIAPASAILLPPQGPRDSARYRIERRVDTSAAPRLKTLSVIVGWDDRQGTARQVELSSAIAGIDPTWSGALSLAAAGRPVHGAFARSAQIPAAAKDLGDGRSVFKPVIEGDTAWVFDNRSGKPTSRCSGIGTTVPTRNLSVTDLTSCDAVSGSLLSGVVRFTSALPANAANANDMPLPLSVALAGGPFVAAPDCRSEAHKVVVYHAAGVERREPVPLAAVPASVGVAAWTETGDRFITYHCLAQAAAPSNGAPARWSGSSTLVPAGWSIGALATQFKVCRYSADQNGDGNVDHNGEHPSQYVDVDGALPQQNFLVVRGDQPCPGAAALNLAGPGPLVFSNLGTAQHQP